GEGEATLPTVVLNWPSGNGQSDRGAWALLAGCLGAAHSVGDRGEPESGCTPCAAMLRCSWPCAWLRVSVNQAWSVSPRAVSLLLRGAALQNPCLRWAAETRPRPRRKATRA